MTQTQPLLELQDVHSYYGNIHALKGISLTVDKGEIVTLIGANGAGKSTTLRTISGIIKPRVGAVTLAGERIDELPAHKVVERGVLQSPEGRRIFPRLSVQENLEMGAFTRTDKEGIAQDMERVFGLFPRLKERIAQKGGTLSGGEQQMLAIGRALMGRPKVLLLDEPSLGLAPLIVRKIFDIIREINSSGTTVFLVEQNAHMALGIANRAYVLQTGRVIKTDTASAMLEDPDVKKA